MALVSTLAQRVANAVDRLQLQATVRREYDRVKREVALRTPDNPAIHGYKVYAQTDEDGILAHIFSKIPSDHVFIEIGCGNGLENNTHALVLSGWRGAWIDGSDKNIAFIRQSIPRNDRLVCECKLVTADNIATTIQWLFDQLGVTATDLLSIDIDSNDIYVLAELLKHISPKVLCVEYNAKFPPPMQVQVAPQPARWAGDDYHGASLASFVATLEPAGYRLVACNLSGVNAFFVHNEFAELFPRYSMSELYQPARFYLRRLASGHPASLKFLANSVAAPEPPSA